jgi:hypothetical protein
VSFNQGRFLEETIRSIVLQGYPNLEYFVLDGGSTDNSVEIIQKYSPWIDFWVSEDDRGQSAAINRGLRIGSGSYATWINSDDMLCKNALYTQFSTQDLADDVFYVGDCVTINESGRILSTQRGRVHSFEDLVSFRRIWRSGGYICQPAVFFPRSLALRVGGLNESNNYSMDYELWGQFFLAGAKVQYTGIPFGVFRRHRGQKTNQDREQTDSTLIVAERLLAAAECLSPETKWDLLSDLRAYRREYPEIVWRQTGRLARLGLPRSIVNPIRRVRQTVERALGSLTCTFK